MITSVSNQRANSSDEDFTGVIPGTPYLANDKAQGAVPIRALYEWPTTRSEPDRRARRRFSSEVQLGKKHQNVNKGL